MNAIIAIMLLCASTGNVTHHPSDQAIIDAYLNSPEIIQAKIEASEKGLEFGDIQTIPYGSMCGAVGCQGSILVVEEVIRTGTNASTTSWMCLVFIGPKGDITRITRMALVPFEELDNKD